ncbi:MAG: MarR family winged helix-turn-helix transcriptional regulator [Asticcacaulis sp.]
MISASTPPMEAPFSDLHLDNQLCFSVYAAAHAFTQAYKPHLGPIGLTYPQYLVMLLLWEKDGRAVNELGLPLHLDSGTLTPLLKRMERAGLVTRRRCDRDERVMRIHLTDAGRALRAQAEPIPRNMLCAVDMPLEDLANLRDTLCLLGQRLRLTTS